MAGNLRALCLLLLMAWQALSCLTTVQARQHAESIAHAVVHVHEVVHHHHQDLSVHMSTDEDGSVHQHVLDGVQPAGLVSSEAFTLSGLEPIAPMQTPALAPPAVFLDGPLRPPRAQA